MTSNSQFLIDWYIREDSLLQRYSKQEVAQIRDLLMSASEMLAEEVMLGIIAFSSAEFIRIKSFEVNLHNLKNFIQTQSER